MLVPQYYRTDDEESKLATAEGRYSLRSCCCSEKIGSYRYPTRSAPRPIGSDDRALIGRAVMPSDALADFELFGLVRSHNAMLRHEG